MRCLWPGRMVRSMRLSNRAALHLPTVSVPVATVLCQGVACLVIKVEVDGGCVVTSACDPSVVDGFGDWTRALGARGRTGR